MKKTVAIFTMMLLVSALAFAGGKSRVKVYITGEGDDGLVGSGLGDSVEDLIAAMEKDFALVGAAEEADLVVLVLHRGGQVGIARALRVTVTLRDGRERAFHSRPGLGRSTWKSLAGKVAKKIKEFAEANEESILAAK